MKTKKAILSILIFAIAALTCCFLFGCAEEGNGTPPNSSNNNPPKVRDPEYKYTVIEDKARIDNYSSGTYEDKLLEIPSEIDGYTVTEIGEYAFRSNASEEIIIPDTVKKIEKGAFIYSRIKSVNIPSSVKTIGDQAFYGCMYLKNVNFSDGLKEIGLEAFGNCAELTEVDFSQNTGITELTRTFVDCYKLSTVKLPSSVTTLFGGVFSNTGLESFHVSENISYIDSAFAFCRRLKEFTVDKDNPYHYAEDGVLFGKNSNMLVAYPVKKPENSYTVPDEITQIGPYAITKADNLVTIDLNNVTNIMERGLSDNGNLVNIIGEKVDLVQTAALSGTKWLAQQDGEYVTLGNALIKYNGTAKEIVLSGYYSVSAGAFRGNSYLEKLYLGKEMRYIEEYAFADCINLREVFCAKIETYRVMEINPGTFDRNADGRKIFVPEDQVELFRSSFHWKKYADAFVPYDSSEFPTP